MSNILNLKGVKLFAIIVLAAALLATFGIVVVQKANAMDCTINSTLRLGSTGAEVMCLQQALGGLTADGKFGPATKAAVMAFQAHSGLTADGVFGPMSKAVWMSNGGNSANFPPGCASASGFSITTGEACHAMAGGNLPAGCTSNSGYSQTTGAKCSGGGSANLPAGCTTASGFSPTTGNRCDGSGSGGGGGSTGGETSISGLSVKDADDDTINEGDNKAPVADIQFDVKDADAKLIRADIAFQADSDNDQIRPWRAFDKVYLMDGSTVLTSEDASDQNNWDDASKTSDGLNGSSTPKTYRIRFTDINKTYREGANNNDLWVAVDVASSVDSPADWTVGIDTDGLRFTDGAGVDTFETSGDTANFSIEAAGQQSDVHVTKDSTSPGSQTLQVKTSTSTTQTIAVFKIKVDSDGRDVKIDDFPVTLATSHTSGLADVVDDVYVVLDGTTYTTDDNPGSAASKTFHFSDLDDDNVVVKAGETMLATVKVKFKSQGSGPAYTNGTTILATSAAVDASFEDANTGDNAGTISGSAPANSMTLAGTGISVQPAGVTQPVVTVTTTSGTAHNAFATYTIKVDVTAFDQDAFISKAGGTAATARFEDAQLGTALASVSSSSLSISSNADTEGNSYRINEGDTETFTFTLTVDPVAGDEGKQIRAQLLTVTSGTTSGSPTGNTFTIGTNELSKYQTAGVLIPAN